MPFFISNPIKRVCRDVTYPVEFLGNQVLGKAYFAAGVASVTFNLVTTVAGVPFRSAEQNTQIYESYKNTTFDFMSKISQADAFTIGEFIGDYFEGAAVGVGYGYALKAAKPLAIKHVRHFKNIKQSVCTVAEKSTEYMDELHKLGGKIKQDFKDDFNHWLGKQEVAVTQEGMLVKVPSQKPKTDGLVMKMSKVSKYNNQLKNGTRITQKGVQKILSQSKELSIFDKILNDLMKNTKDIRFGTYWERITNSLKIQKLIKLEEEFYDRMRKTKNDIAAISRNTGISESIIEKIKSHLFLENHYLRDGIKKFDVDLDIGEAWRRLMNANFVQSDLRLLRHEFAESLVTEGVKREYECVHNILNTLLEKNIIGKIIYNRL